MAKDAATTKPSGPKFHRTPHEVPDFDSFFGDDVSGISCLSNDDIVSVEGRYRYQAALGRGTVSTEQLEAHPFSAVYFFVFRVPSKNDDGEVTGAHYRVVFMDSAGSTYETHSDTASNTLKAWIGLNGWDRWSPPVRFCIDKRKGASGRTYHQLRTVIENGRPSAES